MKENLPEETGLQQLQEDRLTNRKNPLIGYLHINSLRNKITDLSVIMKTLSLDYLILSGTKIDESFSTSRFNVEGYEIRARRDREKYGGGLIKFVRRGLICKRLSLLLPTKSGNALLSTDRLSQAIFQRFSKN